MCQVPVKKWRGQSLMTAHYSHIVQHCKDAPQHLTVGRRGKIVYYTWNHERNEFTEHCNFNGEKDINRDNYMYDDSSLDISKLLKEDKHGQAKQDEVVSEMFKREANPFYVDLASNHWIYISNTYALDASRKWRGICIEPTTEYLAGLVLNRTCTVVKSVVGAMDNDVIEYVHHGSLGGIVGENKSSGLDNYRGNVDETIDNSEMERLYTVTLTTILTAFKAPSVIEYLSLDVEGAEKLVLSGLDFSQYVFLAVTVERPTKAVHMLLVENGYFWATRLAIFGECLYIHKTHKDFEYIMERYLYSRSGLDDTFWRTGRHQPLLPHRYMMRGRYRRKKRSSSILRRV